MFDTTHAATVPHAVADTSIARDVTLPGGIVIEELRRYVPVVQRKLTAGQYLHRAGQPHDGAPQHEGLQAEKIRVLPDRPRRRLVLADRP